MADPVIEIPEATRKQLADPFWRLSNLYWILPKSAIPVQFRPNDSQMELFREMWYRNVIVKARQRGFTTAIDLYLLDTAVWVNDIRAGIIAHNLDDAKVIFRDKVKFAFDHLPEGVRQEKAAKSDRADELLFANNSSVRVSTSYRSGTLQLLHVSEMGKIAAKYPERAREIMTGAMEAVPRDGVVFIESTAEGRMGAFYDIAQRAKNAKDEGRHLSALDFKLHFHAWWKDPEYALPPPPDFFINARLKAYFAELELKHGIKLTDAQKCWYGIKEAALGEDMKREYPSTFDEAFEASVKGAYWRSEMLKVREQKRICSVPFEDALAVDTWWDIGMDDSTAIVFTQDVGREIHVIDYLEDSSEGFGFYKRELDRRREEYGWIWGQHWAPHDIKVREWGNEGKTRLASAAAKGLKFQVGKKVESKQDSINSVRDIIGHCWIDEENCSDLIDCLDNYRRQWDQDLGVYKTHPLHDEYSHGADAFQVLAWNHHFGRRTGPPPRRPVKKRSARGWT